MRLYPEIAVEKAMKRQEIILRAYAKKISWIEAAEILGYSPRHLRRVREKYEEDGFDGLVDGRLGRESPRRMPVATVEEVLSLYPEKYFDFNVTHFVEKLHEEYSIGVSNHRPPVIHPDRQPNRPTGHLHSLITPNLGTNGPTLS